MVYNQFVTPKKCMAATVSRFLRSRQENINNSNRAGINSINGGHFVWISGVFNNIQFPVWKRSARQVPRLASTEPLRNLCRYIRNTWITFTTWPTKTWSVYYVQCAHKQPRKQPTNVGPPSIRHWPIIGPASGQRLVFAGNDSEGWHRRLNARRPLLNIPSLTLNSEHFIWPLITVTIGGIL